MKLSNSEKLQLVLNDLESWLVTGETDDSMSYAFRNGYFLHAANLWLSTGATSEDILEQIEGLVIDRKAEMIEIDQLCKDAFIYICPDCNHHGFYDDDQGAEVFCGSCGQDARREK